MTIDEIKENWKMLGEVPNPLDPVLVNSMGLGDKTSHFLINCGLPSQSAPFLSFVDNSNRELDTLCLLSELYDAEGLDSYVNLGSDGNGNPIVINLAKEDIIEVLDHEQDFVPLDFMNRDVFTLSACLIEFRRFVSTINKTNGSAAFLKGIFSDDQFKTLEKALIDIDKQSALNGYWAMELDMLRKKR